jgi:single-strand DNA-binding protein
MRPRDWPSKGATVAATNINRVILTGNLTRDPELRSLPSGTAVCSLRIACNTRRKQGENCAQYLSKGRPVAVDGRLEWREWEAQDGSGKRQAVEIVADSVQFLGGRDDAGSGNGFSAKSDVPVDEKDFAPSPASGGGTGDDDIPF